MEPVKYYYLAFDIGCIECGEDSKVVGIFKTEEEAKKASKAASEEQRLNWHGQHHFEVFEVEIDEA